MALEIHKTESNPESQEILNNNRPHFTKQCRILFDAMMSGEIITSHSSLIKYNIVDFRRRRCDLAENGVMMTSLKAANTRSKEWFMTKDQINYNQKFI